MTRKTWNYNGHELPEKFCTVIALLKFDDMPPIAATGFIAETTDTQTPYLHVPLFGGRGYDVDLIAKWDYLDEVLPSYCIVPGENTSTQNKEKEKDK